MIHYGNMNAFWLRQSLKKFSLSPLEFFICLHIINVSSPLKYLLPWYLYKVTLSVASYSLSDASLRIDLVLYFFLYHIKYSLDHTIGLLNSPNKHTSPRSNYEIISRC